MEFRKMVMTWDSKRDTDIKNRLLDSVGEGEGGMIWENSIETCILPHVKQMTSPSSMHEAGHSNPVLWDHPEWWDGEESGRWFRMGTHIHPWLIHVDVWQKPPQYCKVISLQLKLIKKKWALNTGKYLNRGQWKGCMRKPGRDNSSRKTGILSGLKPLYI